jgi:carbonic anhydrase/acetyltransferase-like protein (isoleucine patch superfamily)
LAVQFVKSEGDTLRLTDTTQRYENLVTANNTIDIKVPLYKDATIAGNSITIESFIERNALLAGNTITIRNTTIGAGAKIAGSNITLEDVKIEEDVFIAAGTITFKKVTVKGDALITAGNLSMTDSTIAKKLYYSGQKNDSLKTQVQGELISDEKEINVEVEKKSNIFPSFFKTAGLVSGLSLLSIVLYILFKSKKYYDPEIGIDKSSPKHLLIGTLTTIAIYPLLLIITLLSAFFLLPLTATLGSIYTLFLIIASPFAAYYLCQLIFKDKIKWFYPHIALVFLFIASLIPYLKVLIGFLEAVLLMMVVGYYLNKANNWRKNNFATSVIETVEIAK